MKNGKKVMGKRIREVRKKQGIKTEELAKKVGLSSTSFSAIERGERFPVLDTFMKICKELKVDPKYFFYFDLQLEDLPVENPYTELEQLIRQLVPEDIALFTDLIKTIIKRYE